ncbi:MAG: hypothetical protein KF901_13415 [Myxococcales bacterium]|nr:hypothetical protein [Myxococcales bacterium]
MSTRPDYTGVLLAFGFFFSAVLAVLSQGKLSAYQWDVTSGGLVLLLLHALLSARLPKRGPWIAAVALALVALLRPGSTYGAHVRGLYAGTDLSERMVSPDFGYDYREQRAMASLLRERGARRGDSLHVRGYEPTVYVLSGLRSPARFFENHLHSWWVSDFEVLERAKASHYARLGESAPTFFATRAELPVDEEVLPAAGYERVGVVGRFALWKRVDEAAPLPRWPEGWWREPERRARATAP